MAVLKGGIMREGKLRIGPTCYHTLHIVPIMAAHEMNLLSDEGLKTADGSRAYEILRDPLVPFGLEKLGISQGMKERSVDIALDVQSRTVFFQRARGADIYIIAQRKAPVALGRLIAGSATLVWRDFVNCTSRCSNVQFDPMEEGD